MALGGSTNAVVHLPAIAGRAGVALDLDDFDRFARTTPMVASVRPSGKYHMEDLAEAGGIPAVMKVLAPLLHLDALTVTGQTLGAILEAIPAAGSWQEVIAPLDRPFKREGGLAILRGSLAPDGAVLKVSAATPALLRHRGRACVFRDLADLAARIDDPALPVTPDSVLVLQNAGPVGGPGMPEAGSLPIPRKLLAAGVRDMVRVSDARMSGTAGGTVVLHVAPEAAVGGPLALVRDGDEILLDTEARRLDLLVADDELGAAAGGVDARRRRRRPAATGGSSPSGSSRRPRAATSTSSGGRRRSGDGARVDGPSRVDSASELAGPLDASSKVGATRGKPHRELRLRALQEAPDSFGETFADVAARPLSYWEDLTRSVTESGRHVMFLACEGDDVVGSTYGLVDRENEAGRVGGMWVESAWRRRGVGRALLQEVFSWARQQELRRLGLWAPAHSPAALALYGQAGFQRTGKQRPLPTNPSVQIVEMEALV